MLAKTTKTYTQKEKDSLPKKIKRIVRFDSAREEETIKVESPFGKAVLSKVKAPKI